MTTRVFNTGYAPSVSDLKSNIRITSSDLDGPLERALKGAILSAEHHIGKIIGLSTFTLTTDFAQSLKLEGPVSSITSVTLDGVTVSSDKYSLKGDVVTFDASVSGTSLIVVFVAGMSYVPFDIEAAILLHAAALFNNPVDGVEQLPKASTNLLRPYRKWGIDD